MQKLYEVFYNNVNLKKIIIANIVRRYMVFDYFLHLFKILPRHRSVCDKFPLVPFVVASVTKPNYYKQNYEFDTLLCQVKNMKSCEKKIKMERR